MGIHAPLTSVTMIIELCVHIDLISSSRAVASGVVRRRFGGGCVGLSGVVVVLAAAASVAIAIAVVAVVATIGSGGGGGCCGESAGYRNRNSFTVCARQHTSKNRHVALWVYLHACSPPVHTCCWAAEYVRLITFASTGSCCQSVCSLTLSSTPWR